MKVLLAVLLMLISEMALAEANPIGFPYAHQTSERSIAVSDYRIFLSSVKEINNEIRADHSLRLPVKGQARSFQVENGYDPEQVMAFYRTRLRTLGARILFQCQGRDCGPSGLWANAIFNDADLYGPAGAQHYLAALVHDQAGKPIIALVYVIRRGDQQVVVHSEWLNLPEGTVIPGISGGVPRILGPVVVNWQAGISVRFSLDVQGTRELKRWADLYPDGLFVLTSFSTLGEGSFRDAMQEAERVGNALTDVLVARGIPRERMTVIPVGPAIVSDGQGRNGDRVEIVLVRKGGNQS